MNRAILYLRKINRIDYPLPYEEKDELRALMNITLPENLEDDYYREQDLFLQDQLKKERITDVNSLPFRKGKICLYQGDITLLRSDAIVNACNEKLLGCFVPLHGCIDNAIHSRAGLEVRRDMMEIMKAQGHDEPNGLCKVTRGYNLPSSYIFHTVGPKAFRGVTPQAEKDLASCYLSCLEKAEEMKLSSIVFPSISTGVYAYPIEKASGIAVKTVTDYLLKHLETSLKRVIFCLYSERDYSVYERRTEETD